MEIFSLPQLLIITILLMLWVLSVSYIETHRHLSAIVQIITIVVVLWILYMLTPTLLHQTWIISEIEDAEMKNELWIDRLFVYETDVHNAAVSPWVHWPRVIFTSKTYEEMERSALMWVVAHELWHVRLYHMWIKLLVLWVLWYMVVRLYQWIPQAEAWGFLWSWSGLMWLFFLVLIRWLIYMAMARIFERQADVYASQLWYASELADYFESSMQDTETAHRSRYRSWVGRFLYLHDSPQERIRVLRKM